MGFEIFVEKKNSPLKRREGEWERHAVGWEGIKSVGADKGSAGAEKGVRWVGEEEGGYNLRVRHNCNSTLYLISRGREKNRCER